MTSTPIKTARQLSRSPRPTTEPGMCLRETRELFNAPAYALDATEAWHVAEFRHKTKDVNDVPAPAPMFWTGGSKGHGHVAVKARKRGYVWSVDIKRPGYWDRVPFSEFLARWGRGLVFVGWTEDINGQRVIRQNDKGRWVPL